MIKEVVACLQAVHGRAAGAVEEWQKAHRRALERRREQERYRGLLRTVVRAWREEADGRKAMSLRVALPRGVNVQAGAERWAMQMEVVRVLLVRDGWPAGTGVWRMARLCLRSMESRSRTRTALCLLCCSTRP